MHYCSGVDWASWAVLLVALDFTTVLLGCHLVVVLPRVVLFEGGTGVDAGIGILIFVRGFLAIMLSECI